MAYRKVELTKEEEEALSSGGDYFKFPSIGTKMVGRYLRTTKQTGNFAKADLEDYVFKIQREDGTVGEAVVTTNKRLHAQLKKADLKPNVSKVKITFVSELDVGQASKMKVYDVEFDNDSPPKNAAPPPPPPPKPAADDDVPF